MLTGSTLIMVPTAWVIEGPLTLALAPQTWGAILYYAVIATALAYLLYYRVLAMAGSGNVMLCTLMIAPIAIILGALVLDESLDPQAYLGFALLSVGLIILDGRLLRRLVRKADQPAQSVPDAD
jgi:drug/metabolite transporter (DMT)-like permease